MLHRKFGKILLGKATPFQVIAACVLGAMLGFVPGVLQAPGSILFLLGLLAVLNANLWLAAVATLGTKLLGFALLPVAHAIGRFLLEGPTEGMFRSLVNTPVLAWFGLEYHAVAGGLLLGGLLGLGLGICLVAAMSKLRTTFLGLDEGSEKFRKWANKRWVKMASWLLLGGSPKKATYEKLTGKKFGNPIRPVGVVLVAGIAVLIWAVPSIVAEPILTGALRAGLERANGATVDLVRADIDLGAGRFTLEGLAMADRGELDRDVLRATSVTADIDVRALLTRRWQIDELILEQASTGVPRKVPGARVSDRSVTVADDPPAETPDDPVAEGEEIVTLDEVIAEAKQWKERLGQVRRVIDMFVGGEEPAEGEVAAADGAEDSARADRIAEDIRAVGYAWTRATDLIEKSPTLRLDHLKVARLEAIQLEGMLLVLEGWNLSTHPALVAEPAGFSIASDDGTFRFALNPAEGDAPVPTPETLVISRLGLSGDALGRQLRIHGEPVLAGGTIDIEGRGRWWRKNGVRLDLPLKIKLRGCEIRLPGSDRMERIDELVIPIGVTGRLLSPRFRFRQRDLIDGLIAAGRRELADRATRELGGKIDAEVERGKKRLEEKIGKELEGKLDDETKKAVEKLGGGLLDRLKPKPKPTPPPPPPGEGRTDSGE